MATIIIQENDNAVLDVLTLALSQQGHQTIPVLGAAPEKISALIRKYTPQLVLVDFRSTTTSGASILAAIRKISLKLPVVALSCELNISKKISKMGFDGCIEKPFDLYEFFDTINSCLSGGKSGKFRFVGNA